MQQIFEKQTNTSR